MDRALPGRRWLPGGDAPLPAPRAERCDRPCVCACTADSAMLPLLLLADSIELLWSNVPAAAAAASAAGCCRMEVLLAAGSTVGSCSALELPKLPELALGVVDSGVRRRGVGGLRMRSCCRAACTSSCLDCKQHGGTGSHEPQLRTLMSGCVMRCTRAYRHVARYLSACGVSMSH